MRPATIEQRGPNSHPGVVAGQQKQGAPQDDGMAAFGAPPATNTPQPVQSSSTSVQTVVSGTLRPWPCGHMNRANARFCSICGEPAPAPPTSRRLEQ
ncbi:MAG: zinc ribbon domain-containing protein [Chloroflexi bacterium]|nr:MAG: zinc ribbon domain-containing protein [Chloroflexota bacterium]